MYIPPPFMDSTCRVHSLEGKQHSYCGYVLKKQNCWYTDRNENKHVPWILKSHHHITYVVVHSVSKNASKAKVLQHTFSAVQVSRIWTPPIPSAHSSHCPLWNQTWVTAIEHL